MIKYVVALWDEINPSYSYYDKENQVWSFTGDLEEAMKFERTNLVTVGTPLSILPYFDPSDLVDPEETDCFPI